MLSTLELRNFKGFGAISVPMAPLTLLTGINGTGKSSVIQVLALLRQSALERLLPAEGLLLNGPMVELGTARDVLWEFAEDDEIHFEVIHSKGVDRWAFDASKSDADLLP
ncbi:MAG: AAA family ATPase, partial [Vicinamibacterales bacterium]